MSSIVERLASCSVSGRDLGTDIHMHNPRMLHFFWKGNDSSKICYTHFLERKLLETNEFTLIEDYLSRAGLSGACECLSTWLPADERFRPCPFWTRSHKFHRRYHLSTRRMSIFKFCQCLEIDMLSTKDDVTTTIFCLGRHSLFSSRVPHTPNNATRALRFMFPESSTSSHISNILLL